MQISLFVSGYIKLEKPNKIYSLQNDTLPLKQEACKGGGGCDLGFQRCMCTLH